MHRFHFAFNQPRQVLRIEQTPGLGFGGNFRRQIQLDRDAHAAEKMTGNTAALSNRGPFLRSAAVRLRVRAASRGAKERRAGTPGQLAGADETAAELDALLPALLDRAFKGES